MLKWAAARLDTAGAEGRKKRFHQGWPASSKPGVGFLEAGGVSFRYREKGQGQPIIFAADPPVTLELYDEIFDLFSPDYRVIVFEMPAMGFSVPGFLFDFRFRQTNDAVAAFVKEAAAGEPAVLVFSCVAGLGALDIAGRYPELASHVVLIQTPNWSEEVKWKKSRDPKRILAKPFIGQLAMKQLKKSRGPMWLNLSVGRKETVPAFCACAQETLSNGAGWALATAFQSYLPEEAPPFARVTQPTLAIWGVKDGSHPNTDRSTSLWLSDHMGNRFVEYEDLGHFPELEDAPRIHAEIVSFLKAS